MAIDADLNAGLITQDEARERREDVSREADFYGAMDGASKFVRGDAIAGLIITAINIIGGITIGLLRENLDFTTVVKNYTILTIGDGLVTQIPAFLISLAAGLIVTRTSGMSNLPRDVVSQLFHHPEALFLASLFLFSLSFTGLPPVPMLTLSLSCGLIGFSLTRRQKTQDVEAE